MRPDPRAAAMPEDRGPDSLEANLRRLLDEYRVWGYHPRNSIGGEKGWVDWVLLGPAGAMFAELKSEYGKPTPSKSRSATCSGASACAMCSGGRPTSTRAGSNSAPGDWRREAELFSA